MAAREVRILVTNDEVSNYEARSYPHDQMDSAGFFNLYRVPVYKIVVLGTDSANAKKSFEFMAPRFMPYFNDPARPDSHYAAKGWVNAGLSAARTVKVSKYKPDYEVRNRYSPGRGAIVIKDAFFIHAGPASREDVGFGSAGCIEIIGNYDTFKGAIATLSGIPARTSDEAILELVRSGRLIVVIEPARAPNIKSSLTRKVRFAEAAPH